MIYAGILAISFPLEMPAWRRIFALALTFVLPLPLSSSSMIFNSRAHVAEIRIPIERLEHELGSMTPRRWREVSGLGAIILAEETFGVLGSDSVSAAPTQGSPAGSTLPINCPKGAGNTDMRGTPDGCLTAPTGIPNNTTLFQHSDYFSGYANQSGQTYSARPPWNVAAVDYPVGIPGGTIFRDPAIPGILPSGCSYNATGSGNRAPIIACAFNSTGNVTFDSFDFSGTLVGSHGCVLMNITSNANIKVTFKNNYWKRDAACTGKYNYGLAYLLIP